MKDKGLVFKNIIHIYQLKLSQINQLLVQYIYINNNKNIIYFLIDINFFIKITIQLISLSIQSSSFICIHKIHLN